MVKNKDDLPSFARDTSAPGLTADGSISIGTPEEMKKRFDQYQQEKAEVEAAGAKKDDVE